MSTRYDPFTLLLTVASLALLFCGAAAAGTIHVPRDHVTIQSAIDSAQAGDVILVAAGTYAERIRLRPGVTLKSAGDDTRGKTGLARAEGTIIDGGGESGKGPGVVMAGGATLDGFSVTRVGLYDDAEWKRHNATQGEEQSRDRIGRNAEPGILVPGVDCDVRNNIVHHNGDTGIGIRGAEERGPLPRVESNICYRNMGAGIGSTEGATALIRSNRCYENFHAGIGHANASPLVFENTCFRNVRAGIGISEGSSPIVRGNRCYENRRAGIGVRSGEKTAPVVEENDCHDNAMAGIGCRDGARPVLRFNRCYRNAMAGIGSRDGARPIIVGNRCYENRAAGIGSNDSRPLIVDNESRENEAAGIGVSGGAVAIICDNRCVENRLVAIGIPDGSRAFIHGNELSRTGGMPPLVAVLKGSSAVLTDNVLRGGGVAGVLVDGAARVEGNRFLAKGPKQGNAVWARRDSTAAVCDNVFEGYRSALNAGGSGVLVTGNTVKDFRGVAIRVAGSTAPAHVFGNRAVSRDAKDRVVSVEGPRGIVDANELEVEAPER